MIDTLQYLQLLFKEACQAAEQALSACSTSLSTKDMTLDKIPALLVRPFQHQRC
jgi:hypothetical protein